MRTEKCKMNLHVKFTREEVAVKGEDLANLHVQIAELEKEKKKASETYKGQISALEATANRLVIEISKGVKKPVDCEATYDEQDKITQAVRLDTGEVLQDEDIEIVMDMEAENVEN